jgi:hypothetical protein
LPGKFEQSGAGGDLPGRSRLAGWSRRLASPSALCAFFIKVCTDVYRFYTC